MVRGSNSGRDEVRGSNRERDEGQWKQQRGMRSGEEAEGGMRVSGSNREG